MRTPSSRESEKELIVNLSLSLKTQSGALLAYFFRSEDETKQAVRTHYVRLASTVRRGLFILLLAS